MKTCRVCKEEKDESCFGTNGTATRKDGTRYKKTICRPCDAARRRAEHANNPEKIRASNRDYYKRNADYMRNKTAKWRKENPEKTKAMIRDWYERNKEHAKDYRIKYNYGISLKDYERMVEEQEGKCYICGEEKELVIDHCHDTGKVRKLLCAICNTFIGKIGKDMKRTYKGLHYLEEHKGE